MFIHKNNHAAHEKLVHNIKYGIIHANHIYYI